MKYTLAIFVVLGLCSCPAWSQVSKPIASDDGIVSELLRVEREKDRAHLKGDTAVLARIYADD